MIKDLILIGCIVVSSFIFTLSTKKNNNNALFHPQMMFILLSLGFVVIHKVFYMRDMRDMRLSLLKSNKEGFQSDSTDLAKELLNFTSGQSSSGVSEQVTSMSESARREYLAKMDELNSQITSLNSSLSEHSENPLSAGGEGSTSSRMSAENMQKMQNFQIDFLQKQVEKSKQLLQQQEIEENSKKYKPIKVYSSCAVSSADGAFSEDTFQDSPVEDTSTTSESANRTAITRTVSQQSGNSNQFGTIVSEFLNNLGENSRIDIQ